MELPQLLSPESARIAAERNADDGRSTPRTPIIIDEKLLCLPVFRDAVKKKVEEKTNQIMLSVLKGR